MKKFYSLFIISFIFFICHAQEKMTPELLWKLGRVTGVGVSNDKNGVIYTVSVPDAEQNKSTRKTYYIPLNGGAPKQVPDSNNGLVHNSRISPDGKYLLTVEDVKMRKVYGKDFYPELSKSTVQIYDQLAYRHWDEWEDGAFSHVFLHPLVNGRAGAGRDLMAGQPYDCPQKPFGGDEDYIWSPDSKSVLYVTKAYSGTKYAQTTNTDIFKVDIIKGGIDNISGRNEGYDTHPEFSSKGTLAWLSMSRDGYEADKQDIVVKVDTSRIMNLTQNWDNSVDEFVWAADGNSIFFDAAIDGTKQLFEVTYPGAVVRQITKGDFDVADIVGQSGNSIVVARTDMNHAAELYTVDIANGSMKQLTHVNDEVYNRLAMSKIEKRTVTTTDKKGMTVWVIYPPDFDKSKKYPTLLYCQGGPQSPLTQSYSFRWNFQLMAANGYIIVAPNRRGMYGHGREWNEEISKDWGGQVMKDYLTAIDDVSKESYVDKSRLGCIGASYGGYSVYYLAGIHNNRFKTFIAHDGVFDTKTMSGTTEEVWFTNWDLGGNYWDKNNKTAQRSYNEFNPSTLVDKWNTPILIVQGGHDYRVPIEQGLMAFQAAQLRGIKSKLLFFPEENHWVLKPQNALVWQHEFFKWLADTLPSKTL